MIKLLTRLSVASRRCYCQSRRFSDEKENGLHIHDLEAATETRRRSNHFRRTLISGALQTLQTAFFALFDALLLALIVILLVEVWAGRNSLDVLSAMDEGWQEASEWVWRVTIGRGSA